MTNSNITAASTAAATTVPVLNDIVAALEGAAAQVALPAITNIRNAFSTIQATPGNAMILAEQQAIITANIATLANSAPTLVPVLTSVGISAGAGIAVTELDKVITLLQGTSSSGGTTNTPVSSPAPSPSPTPAGSPAPTEAPVSAKKK